MTSVTIPYSPRHPGVHETLESRRFVVLVAHRRFGKTVLAVNHLLKSALLCGRERGSFAYVAPFRNQAREIAWAYLKHYSAALPGRRGRSSQNKPTRASSTRPTAAKAMPTAPQINSISATSHCHSMRQGSLWCKKRRRGRRRRGSPL